ncbi:mucin-17-like [Parasteatoda tepidariorum]|uniref:mucin-17-like n=1 Tax=Parasteatoda tepidariorum TaxID=114398 RepID=UPI001C71AD86|nr:mucin-6-like [Parasteatoda tepidariorum]
MKMKVEVIVALLTFFAYSASAQLNQVYATVQRPKQLPSTHITTSKPYDYTTISLSPKTSISVQHSIVRNQPAYPFPYTETTLQADGSEDTSYYYTYEETSEETTKKPYMLSPPPTTPGPSTKKPAVRSFWNSQKALLDARRKESSQKFVTSYTTRSTERPKIEFKAREKPKFGLASKSKFTTTTTAPTTEDKLQTTTVKSVKYNANNANSADNKAEDKVETAKGIAKDSGDRLTNKITGRIGELPYLTNPVTQVQPYLYPTTVPGNSKQVKFDDSMGTTQLVDNSRQVVTSNYKPLPSSGNDGDSKTISNLNKQIPLLASFIQQQSKISSTQPPTITTASNSKMDPNEFLKRLLSQQILSSPNPHRSNINQQPLASNNHLVQNQNKLPLPNANFQNFNRPLNNIPLNPLPSNLNQQTSNFNPQTSNFNPQTSNFNPQTSNTILATLPLGSGVQRAGELLATSNTPASTLLSRLGNLALNLGGGDAPAVSNYITGRDGGGSGLAFNLGPIPDPLTVLLKLLSLLPRPLLDLNGKIFFGIELGKNAGLTTKPIG